MPECDTYDIAFTPEEVKSLTNVTGQDPDHEDYSNYLRHINEIYSRIDTNQPTLTYVDLTNFQLELFTTLINYKLTTSIGESKYSELTRIRSMFESERISIEEKYEAGEMPAIEFAQVYNKLTEWFQNTLANVLTLVEYKKLLELDPEETIVLGDPEIASGFYQAQD